MAFRSHKEYRLLRAHSASELAQKVSELMHLGWGVAGGVQLDHDSNGTVFYQAVIKS